MAKLTNMQTDNEELMAIRLVLTGMDKMSVDIGHTFDLPDKYAKLFVKFLEKAAS